MPDIWHFHLYLHVFSIKHHKVTIRLDRMNHRSLSNNGLVLQNKKHLPCSICHKWFLLTQCSNILLSCFYKQNNVFDDFSEMNRKLILWGLIKQCSKFIISKNIYLVAFVTDDVSWHSVVFSLYRFSTIYTSFLMIFLQWKGNWYFDAKSNTPYFYNTWNTKE